METSTYQYQYFIKDHLGSVRVCFTGNPATPTPDILQVNDYYPFGMSFAGSEPDNPYQYNGKELYEDHGLDWYDYGARMYDPQIGRFHTSDRFAEKYYSLTNYGYAANNPVLYIDVNGDSINFNAIVKAGGIDAVTQTLWDLSEQTGLSSLALNSSGMLSYGKDDNGNPSLTQDNEGNVIGSKTARDDLISAIDNEKITVNVFLTDGRGSKGTINNMIGLDSKQINGFIHNTHGKLTSKTMGYGLSFLHELYHTELGGGLTDPGLDLYGTTGQTVNQMNNIRRELDNNPINSYLNKGKIYGQRAQYHGIDNGQTSNPNIRNGYIRFIGKGNIITYQIKKN